MNNNKENFFTKDIKIKRALISVTDKHDIEKIAKVLVKNKIEILSTGGTAKYLKQNSIPVKEVSDQTKCHAWKISNHFLDTCLNV